MTRPSGVPKMCIAAWAAPIASLMIEKYLKDSIAADRKAIEQRMMEANLILATIAQQYRLRMVAGQEVVAEPMLTLRPKHNLMMRLEAVQDSAQEITQPAELAAQIA